METNNLENTTMPAAIVTQQPELLKPLPVTPSDPLGLEQPKTQIQHEKQPLPKLSVFKKTEFLKHASMEAPPIEKLSESEVTKIKESLAALTKIKDNTIPFADQGRFIPTTSGVAALIMRKVDGTQVIDRFEGFTFVRDLQHTQLGWMVFKRPTKKIGKFVIRSETIKRLINPEIAIPTIAGYFTAIDATNFSQVPFTKEKDLIAAFHKLDKELNSTQQGLILANTEADRLKKRGSFMEKYGTQIMLFISMIMLAICIMQEASNIAGLKTQIVNLAGSISNLGGLLPKIAPGLPSS